MKTSLDHIPERKQKELVQIVKIIKHELKIEMVILYGSYARGDYVDNDITVDRETGRKLSYDSDFDILAITRNGKQADDFKIWNKIEKEIKKYICTPVSLIVECIEDINEKLSIGRYFYVDIKKEGISLYRSGRFDLARARKLDNAMKKHLAKEDRKLWLTDASQSFVYYEFGLKKRWNKKAVFNLHQTTEALLAAASLVLTSYKPKTHDLEKLMERMEKIEPEFAIIFPRKKKKEKRLFALLKKAYVDVRYSKTYKITKRELEYLAERVLNLQNHRDERCPYWGKVIFIKKTTTFLFSRLFVLNV